MENQFARFSPKLVDGSPPQGWRAIAGTAARTGLALLVTSAILVSVVVVWSIVGFFYQGHVMRREGVAGFTPRPPPVRILTPAQAAAEQIALRVRNLDFEMAILLHPDDRLIETVVNRAIDIVRNGGDAAVRAGERVGPTGEAQPVFAIPALQHAAQIVGAAGAERAALRDALAGRADLAIDLHGTFWADLRLVANTVDVAQPAPRACVTVRSLTIWRPGSPEVVRVGTLRAGRLCWRGPTPAADGAQQRSARWVHIR